MYGKYRMRASLLTVFALRDSGNAERVKGENYEKGTENM